jgi:hypothetical protein
MPLKNKLHKLPIRGLVRVGFRKDPMFVGAQAGPQRAASSTGMQPLGELTNIRWDWGTGLSTTKTRPGAQAQAEHVLPPLWIAALSRKHHMTTSTIMNVHQRINHLLVEYLPQPLSSVDRLLAALGESSNSRNRNKLRAWLEKWSSRSVALVKSGGVTCGDQSSQSAAQSRLMRLERLVAQLRSSFLFANGEELKNVAGQSGTGAGIEGHFGCVTSECISLLTTVAIEESIYRSHAAVIDGLLRLCYDKQQQALYENKLKLLHEEQLCQSDFDVNPEHQSPTDYQSAVAMLDCISECYAPTAKLLCVVLCNQEIVRLHSEERRAGTGAPIHLGADHTLPIYLFVVSCALVFHVRPLHTLCALQTQTDSRLRDGEAGYYLTMCASALEFILKDGHRSDGPAGDPKPTSSDCPVEPVQLESQKMPAATPARSPVLDGPAREPKSGERTATDLERESCHPPPPLAPRSVYMYTI